MIKNKLNLNSNNLQIDWIGFTIKDINLSEIKSISRYLFENFNFNVSKKIKGSDTDEKILWKDEHSHSCYFLIVDSKDSKGYWKNDFWQGISLVFSGKNAHHFFEILNTKDFDFSIFDLTRTNLTRIDVNRIIHLPTKKENLNEFFHSIIEKARINNLSFSYTKDKQTGFQLLTLGNRSSKRYYRIYYMEGSLKFEYEIKKSLAKSFQSNLFSNNLEAFSQTLVTEFFGHSNNILILHSIYTNWLIDYTRNSRLDNSKLVNAPFLTTFLKSSELLSYNDNNAEDLFRLFQLVSFIYTLDKSSREEKFLANTPFYDTVFPLKDYLEFLDVANSNYHREYFKSYFKMLDNIPQNHRMLAEIPDISYRSFVVFPGIDVKRANNKAPWMVYLSVSKEFCQYAYQFVFPSEFLKLKDKHDKIIKLHLLHVICSFDYQKQLDIETFISNYPVSLTRKKDIRDRTASLLMELSQTSWLSPKFHLIDKKGNRFIRETLSGKDLLDLKYIYLFER